MKTLLLLSLLLLGQAHAQTGTGIIEGLRLRNGTGVTNYLKNPDALRNTQYVTASGGSLLRNTTTPISALVGADFAIDANASGQTYTFDIYPQSSSLTQSCEFKGTFLGDASLYKAQIVGTTTTEVQLTNALANTAFSLNAPCTGITSVRFISTSASAAAFRVAGLFFGSATNTANISQATAVLRASRQTTDQAIATNSTVRVAFNTAEYDPLGGLDITTNVGRYTPVTIGRYMFYAKVRTNGTTLADWNAVVIAKNGSGGCVATNSSQINGTTDRDISLQCQIDINNATDYVEVYTQTSSDTSYNVSNGSNLTYFEAYKFPSSTQTIVNAAQTLSLTNVYLWTPETACPTGTIYADGTSGTIDMRATFARGDGSQTVSGVVHTAGALGSVVNDQFQGHFHRMDDGTTAFNGSSFGSGGGGTVNGVAVGGASFTARIAQPITDGTNGTPRTGTTGFPVHRVGKWCKVVATVAAPQVVQSVIASTTVRSEKAAGVTSVDYGTYTPTLTNTTNISASSIRECSYSRMGDVVQGSCAVGITCAAALGANTELTFTLPIATNVSQPTYAVRGFFASAASDMEGTGNVAKVAAAATARLRFMCQNTGALLDRSFSFEYRVVP